MTRMTFKLGVVVSSLMVISLALAACGASASADSLGDTEWELIELNGRDALDDVSVTMLLADDDELSGSSGCNRYFGAWDAGDRRQLTLSPGGQTMMACEPAIMEQETAFLAALEATTTYDIGDERLQLFDADGQEVVEFELIRPALLTGTEWEMVMVENGNLGLVSVVPDTRPFAVFDGSEDNVNGNTGCNVFGASYSRDGDSISIDLPIMTLIACEPAISEQETRFLSALERATTYELGRETLYLRDDEGTLLLWFRDTN